MNIKLPFLFNSKRLLVASGIFLVVIFFPELLTDPSGGLKEFRYSYFSYFSGGMLTLSAMFFALIAVAFSTLLRSSKIVNICTSPFHAVFVGQAILFLYIYIRSAINAYLIYVPLTYFEFIGLATLCLIAINQLYGLRTVFTPILNNKWNWIISFFIFFLVCVGISEHEIPRQVMLSSDPDQHAFFAKQIERFGTIPYHQFYWGEESYNYPAGTGVIGFIWSFFTGLDARNAFTIQPLLQSYIAILIVTEMVLLKKYSLKELLIVKLGLVLVFALFLTYSLTKNYYHLEGAGRLASISICAFSTSCFFWSKKNFGLLGKVDLVKSVSLFLLVIFVGAVINPVNIVYLGMILGFSFLLLCGSEYKYYTIVFILLLIPVLLFLDPYYFDLVFSQSGELYDPIVINPKPLDLSVVEFFEQFIVALDSRTSAIVVDFFAFHLIPGDYSYLVLLLTFGFGFILVSKSYYNELITIAIFFIMIICCWIVFSALFDVLKSGSSFRLLGPYFQFSKYQYLYIGLSFVLALFIERSTQLDISNSKLAILCILFLFAASIFGRNVDDDLNTRRANYCGSIGCASSNDLLVIKDSEKLFNEYRSQSEVSTDMPRILIPNIPLFLNTEKWLFPVGGARVLPFVDTFPAAFFYGQGKVEYTYENYIKNVCKDFDLAWMKENNIQYFFKPEQMLSACVKDLAEVKLRSQILSEHGNSYLIKLY